MNRRKFIWNAGLTGLASLSPLRNVFAVPHSPFTSLIDQNSDRVLVLVQLFGGNDGLNTVVPLPEWENLLNLRENIMPNRNDLLGITDTLALHPRMQGMQRLFEEGSLGIIQNVGVPDSNGSHFRSTDVWTNGQVLEPDSTELATGWIGRYLEGELPGFPEGYPNENNPHPPAITIDKQANMTCQGPIVNFSQTTDPIVNINEVGTETMAPLSNDEYGRELEYIRTIGEQSNAYGGAIQDAYDLGANSSVEYPSAHLANQLKTVARLIDGGLKTKVYLVRIGNFDFHADQGFANKSSGQHGDLLEELSQSITAFQDDLGNLGHAHRTVGLTFSEFGRRIRSNISRGTDHGKASAMFFFGNCHEEQIIGQDFQLPDEIGPYESVDVDIDFRDVYGSILKDWFEVSEDRIRNILYPDFTYLPIVPACNTSLPVDLFEFQVIPEGKHAKVTWKTAAEIDLDRFELEMGSDGINFTRVNTIASKGAGSRGITSYQEMDGPLNIGQRYYYRLKPVDLDGSYFYSPIRSVILNGRKTNEWALGDPYPNPANDAIRLPIYAPTDRTVSYGLYDMVGRHVKVGSQLVFGNQSSMLDIEVSRVPNGTYLLKVDTDGFGVLTKRVMIQH